MPRLKVPVRTASSHGRSALPVNAFALSATSATHASPGIAGWFAHPAVVPHGPAKGSYGAKLLRTVKCRCGQLELPLDAVRPIWVPAATHCPFFTVMLVPARCP